MRLLVTRPREDAERFAAALAERGHEAVLAPLLRIEIRRETLDLSDLQALAFTSANGVKAFAANSSERRLPAYTVGDRTAAAARAEGFAEVHSAAGDVEALAADIAAKLRPASGALLHVVGTQVAGDLVGRLGAEGFAVRQTVLYEARPVTSLPAAARTALADGKLDGVAFFSPRTAASFARLVRASRLETSTERLTAFCLSPAVAAKAKALDWADVRVAADPTQAALLAALAGSRQRSQEDPDMAQDGDRPRKDLQNDPQANQGSAGAPGETKAAAGDEAAKTPKTEAAVTPDDATPEPEPNAEKPDTAPTQNGPGTEGSVAEQVIARFGGLRPTATKLGVAVSTVQGWKARGHIPEARHDELRAAAGAHGIDIADLDLTAQSQAAVGKGAEPAATAATPANPWAVPADGGKGPGKAAPAGAGPAAAAAAEEAEAYRPDDDRDFREEEGPDEAESRGDAREPLTPPPQRGGGMVMGFVLAILLFAGGAVAAVFARSYWEPYLPAAPADGLQAELAGLSDRVAELETAPPAVDPARLDALSQRLDGLTRQVAALPSEGAADTGADSGATAETLAELDRRISELAAQVEESASLGGDVPAAPTVDPALVERLEQELAGLQGAFDELRGTVAETGAAAAQAAEAAADAATADTDQIAALGSQLAGLQDQLQQVQGQAQQALQASAGDSGLALALGQLRDALRFSASFDTELAAVQSLIPESDPLRDLFGPLESHAGSGVPTRDELALRFEPMAQAAVAASYDDSWSGRLMSRVSEAVSVRPVGEVEGDSPRARVARAEVRLANNDLNGAVQELSGLDGAAATAAEPWLADAGARLAAEQALSELTRRTLARLTPAAGTARE